MYATAQDMIDRFDEDELVQLTDAAGTGDIDQARLGRAIAEVEPVITGYVAKIYRDAGTDPVSSLLTGIACDLARHRLYRDAAPDAVKEAYDRALAMLKDIARGVIKLDDGEALREARPGAIVTNGREKIFSRSSMEGF